MSVFFIAEAGVNHNGEREMALRLIDAAVDAGANVLVAATAIFKHPDGISAGIQTLRHRSDPQTARV